MQLFKLLKIYLILKICLFVLFLSYSCPFLTVSKINVELFFKLVLILTTNLSDCVISVAKIIIALLMSFSILVFIETQSVIFGFILGAFRISVIKSELLQLLWFNDSKSMSFLFSDCTGVVTTLPVLSSKGAAPPVARPMGPRCPTCLVTRPLTWWWGDRAYENCGWCGIRLRGRPSMKCITHARCCSRRPAATCSSDH